MKETARQTSKCRKISGNTKDILPTLLMGQPYKIVPNHRAYKVPWDWASVTLTFPAFFLLHNPHSTAVTGHTHAFACALPSSSSFTWQSSIHLSEPSSNADSSLRLCLDSGSYRLPLFSPPSACTGLVHISTGVLTFSTLMISVCPLPTLYYELLETTTLNILQTCSKACTL